MLRVTNDFPLPRTFSLHRRRDVTGYSGEGIVADGVVFGDGATVVHWRGDVTSTSVWSSFADAIQVHGHDGATEPVWHDRAEPELALGLSTG